MYVLKAPYSTFSGELFKEVHTKWLKVGSGSHFYFVSFCPWRRSWAQRFQGVTVLNPFNYRFWGELERGILWIDQWPSFCGHKWRELRFTLLAHQDWVIFQQSIVLKGEKRLFEKTFALKKPPTLYEENKQNLIKLKVIPSARLVLQRYCGEEKRGHLLLDKSQWPKSFGGEIFNPHCLWHASETLALAGRHRLLLVVASGWSSWGLWSLTELVLAWLLSGQLTPDLLNWLSANQSRRYPHSQGSLSGTPRNRYAAFKKWPLDFGSFLWRSRRR